MTPRAPADPARGVLWAPWRMEYIAGPKEAGCFLCAAAAAGDDAACRVVRRRGPVFALLNRYPYNNGHLLVSPLRHVAGLEELNAEERLALVDLAAETIRALRECLRAEGFNLGANLGRSAGAGLDSHLHLHIVPRWGGDTNFMPVVGGVKVIPRTLDEQWAQLTETFRRLDARPDGRIP